MLQIVDLDPILIKINVTENDIKNLKIKQKTKIIISVNLMKVRLVIFQKLQIH